jgi:hypothetical protein
MDTGRSWRGRCVAAAAAAAALKASSLADTAAAAAAYMKWAVTGQLLKSGSCIAGSRR